MLPLPPLMPLMPMRPRMPMPHLVVMLPGRGRP